MFSLKATLEGAAYRHPPSVLTRRVTAYRFVLAGADKKAGARIVCDTAAFFWSLLSQGPQRLQQSGYELGHSRVNVNRPRNDVEWCFSVHKV